MGSARNARRTQDYTALNIAQQPIARREDGMRTTGEKDSYEWWYFDAHLDDGSSLVVVFYTKPFIEGVRNDELSNAKPSPTEGGHQKAGANKPTRQADHDRECSPGQTSGMYMTSESACICRASNRYCRSTARSGAGGRDAAAKESHRR